MTVLHTDIAVIWYGRTAGAGASGGDCHWLASSPLRGLSRTGQLVVNDDVFVWDTLPRRVAVCGPGVIGLELGQALARLGGAGGWRAGRVSDPAIRDYAKPAFQQEFYLDPNARAQEMQREDNQVLSLLRDATR